MANLQYKVSLNGVELTDVAIGISVIDKFEEPLDEAGFHLPFTAYRYPYSMRGLITVEVKQDSDTETFAFLIISDDVKEGSKYDEWIHDLTVLEYTHKLDNYLVHSLAVTKTLNNDNPAPFAVIPSIFNVQATSRSASTRAYLPPIEVKTSYYVDEAIIFPTTSPVLQVSGVTTNTTPWEVDGYLIVRDSDGNVVKSKSILNEFNSVDWTPDEIGNYEIEYGFEGLEYRTDPTYGDSLGDIPIYKFYIKVIKQNNFSAYDLLDRVRNMISKFGGVESKLYFDDTRIFDIDEDIEDYLKSIEAPQTYVQKATARQVINSIFQYVNAISRLRYQEDDLDLLTCDFFNQTSGSFDIEDISGYSMSQDAQSLSSKGINWLEQVLPNNLIEPTIKSPSEDNRRTIRSEKIQITADNFSLPYERALYQPKILTVLLTDVYIQSGNYAVDGLRVLFEDELELDLTPRLINREEWLLKETTTDFPTMVLKEPFEDTVGLRENKVGNIYWQRGDTSLQFSDIFGQVFQENLILNVIKEALHETITRYMEEPLFSGSDMVWSYDLTYDTLEWRDLQFDFEYISLEDMSVQIEREDLSFSDYYSESRMNQSDKLLNVSLATRKSYGELQRSGLPTISFSRHHTDLDDLLTVGLIDTDGYVIVQRKLEFHNEYIYATYVATKDHNRLAQFIGLDQAYRWSEIPTSNQVFERIETYSDYLIVTNPDDDTTTDDTYTKFYSTMAMDLIFATLMNDYPSEKTKATLAYIRTDGFLENYQNSGGYYYSVMTPVASFGIKGGFAFTFGFDNNQVAGDGVKTSTVSGNTLYWNNAVRYTDNNGEFSEFWFEIAPIYDILLADTGWTDAQRLQYYPLIRQDSSSTRMSNGLTTPYFRSGVLLETNASNDPLIIEKDSSQSIKVTYQVSVLSLVPSEYIFGQSFFSQNFIVKNPVKAYNETIGTPMYLYTYATLTKYGKFDDLKVKTGYETPILLVEGTNCSFSSGEFEITTDLSSLANWAIGDTDGNLYVACNDNHQGFKAFRKHFRPGLLEIGKTE